MVDPPEVQRYEQPIYKLREIECILICHFLPYQDIFRFCRSGRYFLDVRERPFTYKHTCLSLESREFKPAPHDWQLPCNPALANIVDMKHWLRYARTVDIQYSIKVNCLLYLLDFKCISTLHLHQQSQRFAVFQRCHLPLIQQLFTHLATTLTKLSITLMWEFIRDSPNEFQQCLLNQLPLLPKLSHLELLSNSHLYGPFMKQLDFSPLLNLHLSTLRLGFTHDQYFLCDDSLFHVVSKHPSLTCSNAVPSDHEQLNMYKQSNVIKNTTQLNIRDHMYRYLTPPDLSYWSNVTTLVLLPDIGWHNAGYHEQTSSHFHTFCQEILSYAKAYNEQPSATQQPLLPHLKNIEICGIARLSAQCRPAMFQLLSLLAPSDAVLMNSEDVAKLEEALPFKFHTLVLEVVFYTYAPVPNVLSPALTAVSLYLRQIEVLTIKLRYDLCGLSHAQLIADSLATVIQQCPRLSIITMDGSHAYGQPIRVKAWLQELGSLMPAVNSTWNEVKFVLTLQCRPTGA